MKRLVLLGGLVIAGVVAILFGLADNGQPGNHPTVRVEAGARDEAAIVATLPSLIDERSVEEFLKSIEDDARRAGTLSHALARRGFAAIKQLRLGPSQTNVRSLELARRYQRIRRELAVAPIEQHLAALRVQASTAKDHETRQRIAIEYTLAANALPELYRIAAMAKLKTLAKKG
jgi:hypothetical protein